VDDLDAAPLFSQISRLHDASRQPRAADWVLTPMTHKLLRSTGAATAALLLCTSGAMAAKPANPGGGGGGGKRGPAPTVSLTAAKGPFVAGAAVSLTGKVQKATTPAPVTLQADPYPYSDAEWANVSSANTDATGSFTLSQKPIKNTRYRIVAGTSPQA